MSARNSDPIRQGAVLLHAVVCLGKENCFPISKPKEVCTLTLCCRRLYNVIGSTAHTVALQDWS